MPSPRTQLWTRIALTITALEFFGPVVRDYHPSHAFNPEWVRHARVHLVWLLGLAEVPPGVLFFLLDPEANSGALIVQDLDHEAAFMLPFDPESETVDIHCGSATCRRTRNAMYRSGRRPCMPARGSPKGRNVRRSGTGCARSTLPTSTTRTTPNARSRSSYSTRPERPEPQLASINKVFWTPVRA